MRDRSLARIPVALGGPRHREARRQRQRLLGPRQREVEPPGVRLHRRSRERRHDVGEDERLGALAHRARDPREVVEGAGRGLGVDDGDGVVARLRQRAAHVLRVDRRRPGRLEDFDREAQVARAGGPALRERPGHDREDALRREVRERRLPESGRRRGGGEDESLRAEHLREAREDAPVELRERLAAVADRLVGHRLADRLAHPDGTGKKEAHFAGEAAGRVETGGAAG